MRLCVCVYAGVAVGTGVCASRHVSGFWLVGGVCGREVLSFCYENLSLGVFRFFK